MSKKNKNSLRLDADYTEDMVGFALEAFLTLLSFPCHRFSIEPFSRKKERWLGADARLHGKIHAFRPFYMQFKRPSAYPDHSRASIVTERGKLQLQTKPHTLYFPLRAKNTGQREFQHNILYRLRGHLRYKGLGDAAYVCPLFLDRSAYRWHIHCSGLLRWLRFWRRAPSDLDDRTLMYDGGRSFRFDRIPILAEHVTIPPHTKVTTSNHRYSFADKGSDLCFHSPELLPDGAAPLTAFLTSVSDGFLDGGIQIKLEAANTELQDLIRETAGDQTAFFPGPFETGGGDPIGNWMAWGHYLRTEYEIDQYALVSWKE